MLSIWHRTHEAEFPDDVHFPTLTVNRTMKFALRNKVPNERPDELASRKDFVQEKRDHILNSLGIAHTKKTLVGNEFIRGVSGGERKRVSLAEVLAGQVSKPSTPTVLLLWPKDYRTKREPLSLSRKHRAPFRCGIIQRVDWTRRPPWNSLACCGMKQIRTRRP